MKSMQTTQNQVTLVNADGLILGRMASVVAKNLLNGQRVVIVNAEKAIISGKKKSKVAEAKEFLDVGGVGQGPFHYRRPDRIIRKTVRGMLPFKQPKGKNALKKLKVFISVPEDLKDQQMVSIEEAQAAKLNGPHFTLADLAKQIGWNQGE